MIEPQGTVARASASAAVAADAQARRSAFVVAAVLAAFAAWQLYRGRTTLAVVSGGAGLSLALVCALWAAAARAFHRGWMRLAVALGHVNSRVLLVLTYYGLFVPYGVASRLLARRDPLDRRSPPRQSYWVRRPRTRQPREQFERLF
ncbi:MAG TPA: hypothetical protein VEY09_10880 [Pyrinomonadaceae bacterium]|nr:hypothetical protein [Pyrinomonadaceae bacterium]